MIEVNLYSVPVEDPKAQVGRSVARSRFDKESMGVSVMEFVKGFLKNNLTRFENSIGNAELVEFINNDTVMSTTDFSCVNYLLGKVGYQVAIFNVADDEENAEGVPSGEVIEWNIINRNFIQYDYPTATKIMPGEGVDIPQILRQIVQQSGLFDPNKFSGIRNPFVTLLNNLDQIKKVSGSVNSTLTTQIYAMLGQMGFYVLCLTSED